MKEIIKKIPILGTLVHYAYFGCRKILNNIMIMLYKLYKKLMKIGIIKNKEYYEKWSDLKDKYNGKRCFLVCTGPSLKFEDLEVLNNNNEICFSVNSIIKSLDKTSFRPTFYCIQDAQSFRMLKKQIEIYEDQIEHICLGISNLKLRRLTINVKDKTSKHNYYPYRLNVIEHWMGINYFLKNDKLKFSNDCSIEVNDGSIVAYSVFQIAKYLGFKELYIIGADCDYTGEVNHFDGIHLDYIKKDSGLYHIRTYERAKNILKDTDFKIFNATRGGKLEVFPRVDFDSIFKNDD